VALYSSLQDKLLIVSIRFKDEAAYDAHFQRNYFQDVRKLAEAEGLLAKPLNIR
jgi:quinol monooxygenase YgiN